jgi:hypothetical protein
LEIAKAIPRVQWRLIGVLRFLPGLLANHEMAKTVDPGAPENLYPDNAFKAV